MGANVILIPIFLEPGMDKIHIKLDQLCKEPGTLSSLQIVQ